MDKVPVLAIVGESEGQDINFGIRFFRIPSGYEFSTLIEDIGMVSAGESGLSPQTKEALATLAGPLHLQVVVMPTCPYCPLSVRLAHQMAMESRLVTGATWWM